MDPVANRSSQDQNTALQSIIKCPLLSGVLIEDVLVSTSVTFIKHKLNRSFLGWFVTENDTQSIVHRDFMSLADTSIYLPLIASASSTISLWVF